jgi:hypothetical protein
MRIQASHPGYLVLLVAVAVTLLAISCGSSQSQLDRLRSMEEARLVYPGASEVGYDERPAERTLSGPLSAYLVWVFGMQDPAEEVVRWHDTELSRRGWLGGGFAYSSATQYDASVTSFARRARLQRHRSYATPTRL